MTRGALIFAFNNEQTDYLAMAEWSARRIQRHLNIPVAVVTDDENRARNLSFDQVIAAEPSTGGTRWFEDYDQTVTWYNASRADAYQLTPWDHTLVLDADYVVCSNSLDHLWNYNRDFLCYRYAWDVATGTMLEGLNTFGRMNMPMWWATVMCFRKSNVSQYIFDSMTMVRENWQHYRDLYHIDRPTYRNDFALSIALGIVSGHTNTVDEIPWNLASVLPNTKLKQYDADAFWLEYTDVSGLPKTAGIVGTDFHAMGKRHLENIIAAC